MIKRKIAKKTSEAGLQKGWTRATFIVKKDLLERLKDHAYEERIDIKDIVDTAFENFLQE